MLESHPSAAVIAVGLYFFTPNVDSV